jgi:hypothetical protein
MALKYLSLDLVDADAASRTAVGYRAHALYRYRLSRDKLRFASNSSVRCHQPPCSAKPPQDLTDSYGQPDSLINRA